MPLFELAAVEIATLIAEEEAAAMATAAAEAAAEAAVNEAGAQEVARQGIMQAPVEAGAGAGAGAAQAGVDVNAGVSQGITGVEPAQPLPQAGPNPQLKPGIDFANAKSIEPFKPLPNYGQGTQLANAPGFNPEYASDAFPNQYIPNENIPEPSLFQNANADSIARNRLEQGASDSAMEAAVNSQAGVEPTNPFMQGLKSVGSYVDSMHPLSKGLGAYGLLSASGALRQEGASPPGQRTFNNPYHFSKDFKGTHPNPNDYQYTPRYAMGGITDLAMGGPAPQTNFANPAQSMMGTSQYSMATDPMSGNIAQRNMAEGGVTGSGQMQLNVPINVGGAGGGGGGGGSPYTPAGGGGYAPPGGPQGHPPGGFDRLGVDKLGGPQGGGSGLGSLADILNGQNAAMPYPMPYQDQGHPLQALIGTLPMQQQQQQTAQLLGPTQSPFAGGSDSTNSTTSADMGYTGPVQRGLGGKGGFSQQPADNTGKGIGFAKGGSTTDIYDASLRFADMLDNPSRYTPPDTRFHSVDTFRDTNPNTANKLADEAAETRRKAIEQRSYVNTGAKFPTVSRRPGQLDLGPVGGERGKYDNQESILAAQGGIMGYNLGGYASGGNPRLLRGPGDGMSDNIPATIADRQPARLADGEFVVPADVVSHLGNGSTEAGAKKLHEMMNSVRQARTGNPKQGKKINPNKFMPKK